ncbi:MAG TPA: PEGA domain-containing protein [Candidatus Binatia bacterium]|nr:PEGA domain-containing protein [Candidatus Binatia bacterium]
MTLRNRFLLVGLGVLVFIITTPVIVLYALGYSFDLETRQITKTGSLIVRSEPNKADIFIDDKLQKDKTDSTLRFLLPGDYNIKISKNGYQSWTKRLNVRSGIVTWANHDREFITLFYETPKEKSQRNTSLSAVSVRNNEAVIVEGSELSIMNGNRQNITDLNLPVPVFSTQAALPSNQTLYDLLRYAPSRSFTAEQISSSKHLEANDNYAVILIGTDLYVSRGQTVSLLVSDVSGFTLENEHLWYVQQNTLKHSNLNLGISETISTLPNNPVNSQVIRGESHIFLIMDQNLYALNDTADEIYRGVNYAYWDSQMDRLVFANNNEALLFNPENFRTELIIRSSTSISQPVINKRTGYLFFINEDKIKAIELDGRDHRNVYTIASKPAKSFLISEDGKLLTIFTDTEMQTIEIRE